MKTWESPYGSLEEWNMELIDEEIKSCVIPKGSKSPGQVKPKVIQEPNAKEGNSKPGNPVGRNVKVTPI